MEPAAIDVLPSNHATRSGTLSLSLCMFYLTDKIGAVNLYFFFWLIYLSICHVQCMRLKTIILLEIFFLGRDNFVKYIGCFSIRVIRGRCP